MVGSAGMRYDLRLALRALARSPLFTAVAVLSLALGIGANTSIFSLLDQVLYRSLPVRDPKALVVFHVDHHSSGSSSSDNQSERLLLSDVSGSARWSAQAGAVFSGVVAARRPSRQRFLERPDRARPRRDGFRQPFRRAGRLAAMGRAFTPEDDGAPGAHPVVMLSHDYWVRRFAADPGVFHTRKSPSMGIPCWSLGWRPPDSAECFRERIRTCLHPSPCNAKLAPTWDGLDDRRTRWLNILARLKPGSFGPAGAGRHANGLSGR